MQDSFKHKGLRKQLIDELKAELAAGNRQLAEEIANDIKENEKILVFKRFCHGGSVYFYRWVCGHEFMELADSKYFRAGNNHLDTSFGTTGFI